MPSFAIWEEFRIGNEFKYSKNKKQILEERAKQATGVHTAVFLMTFVGKCY